ncbi:ROK family transcriptional regulator [Calorimonas adulescens]|uniref:ROK family transcriptional regulator n=1 Tax=Calorimonas adulescens TaxID=2606906 RepID=A0A5D8QBE4_9THEO|nr:ROK family transcriptional regulator [Calorimonas adulescens]TZE81454.1 ROK family transcriptional regulator [Calorimonas adulescens]
MKQKNSLKQLKEKNKQAIINAIFNSKGISRAELSEQIGLSPTAVSDLVEELLDEGILEEFDLGISSGGRKPILLKIKPECGYIMVVHVTGERINTNLYDLDFKVIESYEKEFSYFDVPNLQEIIVKYFREIESKYTSSNKRIYGLGICLGEDIESLNPRGILDTSISSERVRLSQAISFELGIDVIEESERDMKALIEATQIDGVQNLAYINIGEYINASIVLNCDIFKYPVNIEHMIIDLNGPKCEEGHRGCLKTLVSTRAVIKKALIIMFEEKNDNINVNNDFSNINIFNIEKYLHKESMKRLVEEISSYLCASISNIKMMFNIDSVVLDGEIISLPGLISKIQTSLKNIIVRRCDVEQSEVMKQVARRVIKSIIYA